MTYPLIYIEWCDAASYGNGTWQDVYDLIAWAADEDSWLVKEVGFVVEETDEYILLVSQVSDNGKVGDAMKIPKGWVRRRVELGDAIKQ